MGTTSEIKKSREAKREGFNPSAGLALTTAGGLTIDDTYDLINITTVTGATVVTVDADFRGKVDISVAGNAGGLTFKDESGNSIGSIAGGTTGTYAIYYNPNATYDFTLLDYGA